jgi:hypothetical protein
MERPHLAFTDNPCHDKEMLLRTFPTLAKRQAAFDKLSEEMIKTAATDCTTATSTSDGTVNDAELLLLLMLLSSSLITKQMTGKSCSFPLLWNLVELQLRSALLRKM